MCRKRTFDRNAARNDARNLSGNYLVDLMKKLSKIFGPFPTFEISEHARNLKKFWIQCHNFLPYGRFLMAIHFHSTEPVCCCASMVRWQNNSAYVYRTIRGASGIRTHDLRIKSPQHNRCASAPRVSGGIRTHTMMDFKSIASTIWATETFVRVI